MEKFIGLQFIEGMVEGGGMGKCGFQFDSFSSLIGELDIL